jgi:putative flavoprotein involved in K+ transport
MPARPASRATAVDVVVVGGGHCGLAMSQALSRRAVDHVVIERGDVGQAWRTERWNSLRLLTPNWMTRLPGQAYDGDDADGYMGAADVVAFLSGYADKFAAPVHTHTTVLHVAPAQGGYRVVTDRGEWQCRAVVLASGAFGLPVVPRVADAIPAGVQQVTAQAYRHPGQLREGEQPIAVARLSGHRSARRRGWPIARPHPRALADVDRLLDVGGLPVGVHDEPAALHLEPGGGERCVGQRAGAERH